MKPVFVYGSEVNPETMTPEAAAQLLTALENVLDAWQEDRTHNRRKWNVKRDAHLMIAEASARNTIFKITGLYKG